MSCDSPIFIFPLNPIFVFLCSTILIIPLIPSGLYLADGLVINSMLLIEEDGICFSNCSAGMFDNLPSTITLTFWLPRKLIDPVC